ncbi:MAG: small basic protein [Candidatus Omnitrophica bacterium]|nr:small basic protein [Candidatus Omnitrophota bacterium]
MSQHSSLKVSSVGVKHRNVFKRHERLKKLQQDGKWQDQNSVLGLPKIKSIKIKVKKTKSEKVEATAEGAAQTPAATPQAKSSGSDKQAKS